MDDLTLARRKELRQLKEKIRGSETHLLVGIDVAKNRHHAFFGTATGKTLFKRLIFDNNLAGFEKLLLQAEAIRIQHGLEKVVFALEPTANYHKPLGQFLIRHGHAMMLASSGAVKNNRESLDGRWDKNDTKDGQSEACPSVFQSMPSFASLTGLLLAVVMAVLPSAAAWSALLPDELLIVANQNVLVPRLNPKPRDPP